MKLQILGNGGAVSDGLSYNSFIIDNMFLIETPPDIINSLYRENININKIDNIFISHFHADHFFGFPLLTLRLFFNQVKHNITIYGPTDIEKHSIELCSIAFGDIQPFTKWFDQYYKFIEVKSNNTYDLGHDVTLEPFAMTHFVETNGFSIYKNGNIIFSYFADTSWSNDLIDQINKSPRIVLTDLNGEPTDPDPVHLSETDIINNLIPISKDNIIYYGTHLKFNKISNNKLIKYVLPGEIIEI